MRKCSECGQAIKATVHGLMCVNYDCKEGLRPITAVGPEAAPEEALDLYAADQLVTRYKFNGLSLEDAEKVIRMVPAMLTRLRSLSSPSVHISLESGASPETVAALGAAIAGAIKVAQERPAPGTHIEKSAREDRGAFARGVRHGLSAVAHVGSLAEDQVLRIIRDGWEEDCRLRAALSGLPQEPEDQIKESDYVFGKDCPVGMVQVEFVGCDPKGRQGKYGWRPEKSAFLEIYVDGKRFRVDVGDQPDTSGTIRRGLHICGPIGLKVNHHSVNALNIYTEAAQEPAAGQGGA